VVGAQVTLTAIAISRFTFSFVDGEWHRLIFSQSVCNVPAAAKAYVTNITLLPQSSGRTNSVTVYPSDEQQPLYTTARGADGNIVANAAIIRAASASGAINVYFQR
jgi:hypothetical protein